MKCAIVFGVVLASVLIAGAAMGDVLVIADFEDQSSLDFHDGGTDLGAVTDTPGGDSVYSTAFRLQPGMEGYEVSLSVGTTHDPGLDISGYTYVNFYMKATGMLPEESTWFGIIGADWQWVMGAGFGEGAGSPAFPEITTEWQYFSLAIDELEPGFRDTPDLTNVWSFLWEFVTQDVTVYIDHITVSDTPDEGRLLPPGPVVYVEERSRRYREE